MKTQKRKPGRPPKSRNKIKKPISAPLIKIPTIAVLEKPPRVRHEFYVNQKELKEEIIKYKKNKIISEKLGEMLIKIAKRYASKGNFSGYTYKDEFIGDAIYRMVEQLDKINIKHPRCNCFSYLTQTCHNKFIAKITEEKKYMRFKEILTDNILEHIEQTENISFKKKQENSSDSY